MKCFLVNLVIISIFFKCCSSENNYIRNRRFLIVPPTSPTRHQLIWGIGIPVDYEYQSIVSGYVLKAQYFLPTETANLYPNPDIFPGIFTRKKREADKNQTNLIDKMTGQQYERYEQEAVLLEEKSDYEIAKEYEKDEWDDDEEDEEDQLVYPEEFKENHNFDFENSRWTAYKVIEKLAETKGFKGRICVLRSICEAAEAPFTHRSGLLGELLHIVLA